MKLCPDKPLEADKDKNNHRNEWHRHRISKQYLLPLSQQIRGFEATRGQNKGDFHIAISTRDVEMQCDFRPKVALYFAKHGTGSAMHEIPFPAGDILRSRIVKDHNTDLALCQEFRLNSATRVQVRKDKMHLQQAVPGR